MFILSSNQPTKQFIRFGKKFTHGKSINYLAMSPRIKEAYSYKLAELQYGYITEDEFSDWCDAALEDYVWEPHTSCFYVDLNYNLPIIENISQVKTLIGFIDRMEQNLPCDAFIVEGVETGKGTDSEPLVDIVKETQIDVDVDDLITIVMGIMEQHSDRQVESYTSVDVLTAKGSGLQYKDMIYYNLDEQFIGNWEYKGQVMDKFKYEEEFIPESSDFTCLHFNCDDYGGQEELNEFIYEWGNAFYDNPEYYENTYHVAILIDPYTGDFDIYGDETSVQEFVDSLELYDYTESDNVEVVDKYKKLKFYS